MDDCTIISYDPFAMESQVFFCKDGHQEQVNIATNLDDLTYEVIALAYKENCYEVKMHAPYAFISEVKRRIAEAENQTYSQNKITVEGI